MNNGYIAVEIDGTLAHYDGWQGPSHIGAPVGPMVDRVKRWISTGQDVRVLTARASPTNSPEDVEAFRVALRSWSLEHIGVELEATDRKCYQMIELWDDRAIGVVKNQGERADGLVDIAFPIEKDRILAELRRISLAERLLSQNREAFRHLLMKVRRECSHPERSVDHCNYGYGPMFVCDVCNAELGPADEEDARDS